MLRRCCQVSRKAQTGWVGRRILRFPGAIVIRVLILLCVEGGGREERKRRREGRRGREVNHDPTFQMRTIIKLIA